MKESVDPKNFTKIYAKYDDIFVKKYNNKDYKCKIGEKDVKGVIYYNPITNRWYLLNNKCNGDRIPGYIYIDYKYSWSIDARVTNLVIDIDNSSRKNIELMSSITLLTVNCN